MKVPVLGRNCSRHRQNTSILVSIPRTFPRKGRSTIRDRLPDTLAQLSDTSSSRTTRKRRLRTSDGILAPLLPPPITRTTGRAYLNLLTRPGSAFLRNSAFASTPITSRVPSPFKKPTKTSTASSRTSPARAIPHPLPRLTSLQSIKVRRAHHACGLSS